MERWVTSRKLEVAQEKGWKHKMDKGSRVTRFGGERAREQFLMVKPDPNPPAPPEPVREEPKKTKKG